MRGILKQRWWWSHAEKEDLDDCHFVWTQWKKNTLLAQLGTKLAVKSERMLELQ